MKKQILAFLVAFSLQGPFAFGQVSIPDRAKLQMARASVVTDANGEAVLEFKIPGAPGQLERLIAGGSGWFDTPVAGDHFNKIEIVDLDSLVVGGYMAAGMSQPDASAAAQSQYPAYPVIGTFHDTETTPPLETGWYMHSSKPIDVESIGGEELLPGGMYMRFVVHKGSAVVDTFRVNLFWGKP